MTSCSTISSAPARTSQRKHSVQEQKLFLHQQQVPQMEHNSVTLGVITTRLCLSHSRNHIKRPAYTEYCLVGCEVMSTVKEVKCTLVQALRLIIGRGGCRGIALLFLDHGTIRGWGVSVTTRPHFTPGKDPITILQVVGWTPGPVWTGAENLVPTGIRSPGRPARSQSLYRLSYPDEP